MSPDDTTSQCQRRRHREDLQLPRQVWPTSNKHEVAFEARVGAAHAAPPFLIRILRSLAFEERLQQQRGDGKFPVVRVRSRRFTQAKCRRRVPVMHEVAVARRFPFPRYPGGGSGIANHFRGAEVSVIVLKFIAGTKILVRVLKYVATESLCHEMNRAIAFATLSTVPFKTPF